MPRRKPWDNPAILLSRHAPSPKESVPLLSRGISSDCPGSCGAFGKPCPPKSPQFIVPGVEIWTLWGPILGADKGWKVPPQSFLSRLGFQAGTESCWKTHSWPLKRVMLSCFTAPCSTSSWYTRTPVSLLSCKNEDVSSLMGHLPPNHDVGSLMASLHPQNAPQGTFEHKSCSGCYAAPRWW